MSPRRTSPRRKSPAKRARLTGGEAPLAIENCYTVSGVPIPKLAHTMVNRCPSVYIPKFLLPGHDRPYAEMFRKHRDYWNNALNDAQRHAVKHYGGNGYKEMNEYMREYGTPQHVFDATVDKLVRDLMEALWNAPPLELQDAVLYRYEKQPYTATDGWGNTFVSASFHQNKTGVFGSYRMNVLVPVGARGLLIAATGAGISSEVEFLLAPCKMREVDCAAVQAITSREHKSLKGICQYVVESQFDPFSSRETPLNWLQATKVLQRILTVGEILMQRQEDVDLARDDDFEAPEPLPTKVAPKASPVKVASKASPAKVAPAKATVNGKAACEAKTVVILRAEAKAAGRTGYSSMLKAQLVKLCAKGW